MCLARLFCCTGDCSFGKTASLHNERTDHRRNTCQKVEAVYSEKTVAEMAAEEECKELDVKNSQRPKMSLEKIYGSEQNCDSACVHEAW